MNTVISLIKKIEQQLTAAYDDHTLCNQYAWWLVEKITQKNKAALIAQHTLELTTNQHEQLNDWLDQLIQDNKPIQYILGSVPFGDLNILVEPPSLIPRPETEEWCTNLIAQLTKLSDQRLQILELCTGSGCIALSLAHALKNSTVVATDIAQTALELAQKNATHNDITNVSFMHSDVYDAIPTDKKFDVIVANPPYITPDEWIDLDKSVKDWEDKHALMANDAGLAIIKRIIDGAPQHLKPNADMQSHNIPQLIIEIGFAQARRVVDLLNTAGYTNITVVKDLEGKDRVVTARVTNEAQSKK